MFFLKTYSFNLEPIFKLRFIIPGKYLNFSYKRGFTFKRNFIFDFRLEILGLNLESNLACIFYASFVELILSSI